jgi:LacI family transcriptional regulator
MTEHLIALGHRRIGFIVGEPRYGATRARREGYFAAMAAHGLPVSEAWVRPGDFTFQSGVEAGHDLLAQSDRPTAVFASSDAMALGCMTAALESGVSVPEDLSIAGFDGSAAAQFSRPTLTTVRQPITEMATQATRRLISGDVEPDCDEEAAPELLGGFELILGQSTAPAARARRRGAIG